MTDTPLSHDSSPLQKRESIRIRLGLAHVPVIEFPEVLMGEHRIFHLVDLSEGGLSFESPLVLTTLALDEEVAGCYIEFSALERISLCITPRHIMECTLLNEEIGLRYGCQISGLTPDSERLIRKTLISREQRQLRMRSKFT
jgi:hypothetical protein